MCLSLRPNVILAHVKPNSLGSEIMASNHLCILLFSSLLDPATSHNMTFLSYERTENAMSIILKSVAAEIMITVGVLN
jgi:hypothetical protein